jgi:hypothetical protein
MVEPASFGANAQTAGSNAFQHAAAADTGRAGSPAEALNALARAELQGLATALRAEGIRVHVAADTPEPPRPDAVFPNNWVSFHADGTRVLYPMLALNRRAERRMDVVDAACAALDFRVRRTLDLTAHEREGRFLEGTGSLVLDHVQRVAYTCLSPRTDAGLVREWARQMDFEAEVFTATDAAGQPYYHTNVMMWIGARCAVLCAESLAATDLPRVRDRLAASGRALVEISRAAVAAFAGNMLELATWDEALGDASLLVMSSTARAALDAAAWRTLSGCVDAVIVAPVPTIEWHGGGSVRCMLAEVPETRP